MFFCLIFDKLVARTKKMISAVQSCNLNNNRTYFTGHNSEKELNAKQKL